nr:EAL domain-containing protein [uncultured Cohaesibacter sp.]
MKSATSKNSIAKTLSYNATGCFADNLKPSETVAVLDTGGRFITASPDFSEFLQISDDEIFGLMPSELQTPLDMQAFQETLLWVIARKAAKSIWLPSHDHLSNEISFIDFVPEIGNDGNLVCIFAHGRTIPDHALLNSDFLDAQEQLAAAVKIMPDVFWIKDLNGRYKLCNDKFHQLLQVKGECAVGKTAFDVVDGEFLDTHLETDRLALASDHPIKFELQAPAVDGVSTAIYEVRKLAIRNAANQVTGILGLARDVTEERNLQANLQKMAFTDSLTSLSNRPAFNMALQDAVESARISKLQCALLLLDLDRFKSINDNLGHPTGDLVLNEVAVRLVRTTGEAGAVFRLSGDEFAILLPSFCSQSDLVQMAEAIRKDINQRMLVSDNELHLDASIGIAMTSDDTLDAHQLYRFADLALYEAKLQGRSGYHFFTPSLLERTEKRFELEAMIAEGLKNKQFMAYFQGKTDLKSGRIVGAEVLCRWRHPAKGWIAPTDFIPIAEDSGQIVAIGGYILEQACLMAIECNRERISPFKIAVNVSARQIQFEDFYRQLKMMLKKTGCQPDWIEIEITEGVLLDDSPTIRGVLERISQMGVSIAIDDFGTGYSSLSYLQNFPIDVLKIDQSFIQGMCTDQKKLVLVKAIVAMAKGLELNLVAEGVEKQQTADLLSELHCETAQGYFWSKPCSANELIQQISSEKTA